MTSLTESYWGLLGIDNSGSTRRSRTLDLGAVVRKFNNLAVPGMGNVWYCKQIYLAALGLAVAQRAGVEKIKVKNIEVANAVECLACILSFDHNNWEKDPRLKGSNKLKGTTDISFSKVRRPGFYVTQPMRMGIVQALPSLGLVNTDTIRFNSFKLTPDGEMLVNRISDNYPGMYRGSGIIDYLVRWIKESFSESAIRRNDKCRKILSPLINLDNNSRLLIKNFILRQPSAFAAGRCNAILTWMDMDYIKNRGHLNWEKKPVCVDQDHWNDLKAGAFFFKSRKKALELLDELEKKIDRKSTNKISVTQAKEELKKEQDSLHEAAISFLNLQHDPSSGREATRFCFECTDNVNCIISLIKRDGLGLMLKGEMIVPGPAFKGDVNQLAGNFEDDENELPASENLKLPGYISSRVNNMFYLNQDLKGTLTKWL